MTSPNGVRPAVEGPSEIEAQNPLYELLESARLDDEPTTPEENEGASEANNEIARGEVLTADEIRDQSREAESPRHTP